MNRSVAARLSEAAAAALPGQPVRFAYLFGSQATGRARPDSDVDVAALLDADVSPDRYLDLTLGLARELAAASGLGGIEVVVLDEAPLPLVGRVLRERVVLYSTDEEGRAEYESRMLRLFTDFDYYARQVDQALLARMAAGER